MNPTLVIFSGLPGTGKSILSTQLAQGLHWPLLRLDDIPARMPASWTSYDLDFWDNVISMLMQITETQLEVGVSVIVDAVFMAYDRHHFQALARKYQARMRPIYTYLSDEKLWEQRVTERFNALGRSTDVANWERIQVQRKRFLAWEPGTALFVDGARPLEQNLALVSDYVTSPQPPLTPLPEIPLVQGRYHMAG